MTLYIVHADDFKNFDIDFEMKSHNMVIKEF